MNIVFITDMYNIGGGEKNLIELTMQMQLNAENVIVLLPCEGQISDELEKSKIKHYEFGLNLINRRWIAGIPICIDFFKVIRIIKFFKSIDFIPHIFHCNASNTIPLAKMLSMYYKSKIVWTCHGPWEVPKGLKFFFVQQFVDKIIAITPEIYNRLNFKDKDLIPLGINKIVCGSRERTYRGKKRILCIARWQHIKGQDILIRAFQSMKAERKNLELHFFGDILVKNKQDIEFYNKIKKMVIDFKLEQDVFFHEFNSNIREHINEFDVLCIPSRYESFSITLLEGLNSGITVIAPNIGGPKYIIEDGVSGIFFEAGNMQSLKEKCINVLYEKIKLDKENILMRSSFFLIEKQCEKICEIYHKLELGG